MSEIWISMREKKLTDTLTLMTDTLTRVTAERDRLRDERDAEREANGLLHQGYAKLTAELAQERQHRNGHLPDCAGMDFENMRCGCGYLDGTAYREAIIKWLDAERDALKADAERYRWLRKHNSKTILGAWWCYHATDSGEADLDTVLSDLIMDTAMKGKS